MSSIWILVTLEPGSGFQICSLSRVMWRWSLDVGVGERICPPGLELTHRAWAPGERVGEHHMHFMCYIFPLFISAFFQKSSEKRGIRKNTLLRWTDTQSPWCWFVSPLWRCVEQVLLLFGVLLLENVSLENSPPFLLRFFRLDSSCSPVLQRRREPFLHTKVRDAFHPSVQRTSGIKSSFEIFVAVIKDPSIRIECGAPVQETGLSQ